MEDDRQTPWGKETKIQPQTVTNWEGQRKGGRRETKKKKKTKKRRSIDVCSHYYYEIKKRKKAKLNESEFIICCASLFICYINRRLRRRQFICYCVEIQVQFSVKIMDIKISTKGIYFQCMSAYFNVINNDHSNHGPLIDIPYAYFNSIEDVWFMRNNTSVWFILV